MDKKISELTQVESIEGIELLAVVQSSETKSATVNQVIEGLAKEDDIPTKTSDLTNDSGFITENDIPDIPTKTSDLENDSGFITSSAISGMVKSVNDETPDSDGNVELTIPTYDVQINGTSILDENNDANIVANSLYGIGYNQIGLYLNQATENLIDTRSSGNRAITPNNLDYAVKKAMGDGVGAAWSDTEKSSARQRIGAIGGTKATAIASTSTDSEIPTAKAVYDLFNSIADVTSVTW